MNQAKIKILLSKLGLDVHNRGIITVARQLRDAGMEVIFLGNALPQEILNTAVQEQVDIIGVSSLGGAHITLGQDLIRTAEAEGLKDTFGFIIGGIFSIEDESKLKEIGFDGVFTAGATKDEIVGFIHDFFKQKTP